jgi:hypothetical protein
MKWIKQTFAVRYNLLAGRTGHIWGDRYWSLFLVGEPAVAGGYEIDAGPWAGVGEGGVRPQPVEMVIITGFSPVFPPPIPSPPP